MTEEAPLNSQSYLLDKETIEVIAKTAQRVDHLAEMMTSTAQKLDRIGDAVGGLKTDVAICLSQKEQIKEIQGDVEQVQKDVGDIQKSTNYLAGKLAVISSGVAVLVSLIVSILPNFIGGR